MPYKDRETQRAYQREWRAQRRAEYFKDKCCVLCYSTDRLELDHIDPEHKISHRIWSWSSQRREEELLKCRVLCFQCHLIKSKTEHAKGVQQPNHKLSEAEILEIRGLFDTGGYSKRGLGRLYRVSDHTIRQILKGTTWSHV